MRGLQLSSVLFLAVLLAGACGSDDGDEADPAADREAAAGAIASFGELMAQRGFTAAPPDDDEDTSELEFTTEGCREFGEAMPGNDEALPGETADEESPDYERGDFAADGSEQTVQASVLVMASPDDVDAVFEQVADERLGTCLAEGIEEELRLQAEAEGTPMEVGDVQVVDLELPDVGEQVEGLRLELAVGVAGFELPVAMEVLFTRADRVAVMMMAMTLGAAEAEPIDVGELAGHLLEEASSG